MFASTAGFVHCDEYARCLARLASLFPQIRFSFRFVKGEKNIADRGSRGVYAPPPTNEEMNSVIDESVTKEEMYKVSRRKATHEAWMV